MQVVMKTSFGGALTRLFLVASLVSASAIVGCAADAKKKATLPIDDDESSQDSPSGSESSRRSVDDQTLPVTPSANVDPAAEPAPPASDPPASESPTPPAADPPTNANKTVTCTSTTTSGHKSVTTMTYVINNTNIKITKLSVLVSNKDNRNDNDIDVWVAENGAAEKKIFNSGDVLTSGQSVSVTVPTTLSLSMGAKVRIETNFDQVGIDPSASCALGL